ncbi:MAG: hypothetical protein GY862_11370 [Gammaproteobacteria bacterium]|nr:hypothetical protein [Gammaproteobacteria bacterium]
MGEKIDNFHLKIKKIRIGRMATEADYQAKIKNFTWNDLDALWTTIQQRDTSGWESGKALEYLILRAFQLDNAEIRWPYRIWHT